MEPWLATDRAPTRRTEAVTDLLDHWEDGRIKLFYTAATLRFRRLHPDLFLRGSYEPLEARGEAASHIVAFARAHRDRVVVALAPRLVAALTGTGARLPVGRSAWQDTGLPLPDDWAGLTFQNVLTGEQISPSVEQARPVLRVADALSAVPATLLTAERTERSQP
jgi:(1->4)-alpha-D-glucan 1-alpha-D-glucosylmutase